MTEPGASPGDAGELARFGYRQQLQRTIRGFSSFALSFSLISMTTGIFGDFGPGLRQAGPAVIWSWTVVLAGQMLVALVLAELSVRYPISGYGYQWTSRLLGPELGFFTGWLLLLQWVAGLPGICGVVGEYLRALPGGHGGVPMEWITVGVISAAALLNIFSIRLAALWNDAGVITEIAGSLGVALVLLIGYGIHRSGIAGFLLSHPNYYTGRPAGLRELALSLLVGAWCLTGFEAAADLAEETQEPARVVPKAILNSLLASGIGGIVVLAGFLLAMGDVRAAQGSAAPMLDVLVARLGVKAAEAVLVVVFVSVFACALATLALTSRLLFAMARDRMLPFSDLLKKVDRKRGTPIPAIVFVWALACAVVLWLKRVEVLTSTSVVAGYLAYALIMLAAWRGLKRLPPADERYFHLGRWGGWTAGAALAWCCGLIAAMTIPEASPGAGHLPAVAAAAGLAVGAGLYFGLVRGRLRRGEAGVPVAEAVAARGVSTGGV